MAYLYLILPKKIAVLTLDQLQKDPTYGGLMEFLNQDVSDEQKKDMGGRDWIQEKIFGEKDEPQYSRHDIEHLTPFSNHLHGKKHGRLFY